MLSRIIFITVYLSLLIHSAIAPRAGTNARPKRRERYEVLEDPALEELNILRGGFTGAGQLVKVPYDFVRMADIATKPYKPHCWGSPPISGLPQEPWVNIDQYKSMGDLCIATKKSEPLYLLNFGCDCHIVHNKQLPDRLECRPSNKFHGVKREFFLTCYHYCACRGPREENPHGPSRVPETGAEENTLGLVQGGGRTNTGKFMDLPENYIRNVDSLGPKERYEPFCEGDVPRIGLPPGIRGIIRYYESLTDLCTTSGKRFSERKEPRPRFGCYCRTKELSSTFADRLACRHPVSPILADGSEEFQEICKDKCACRVVRSNPNRGILFRLPDTEDPIPPRRHVGNSSPPRSSPRKRRPARLTGPPARFRDSEVIANSHGYYLSLENSDTGTEPTDVGFQGRNPQAQLSSQARNSPRHKRHRDQQSPVLIPSTRAGFEPATHLDSPRSDWFPSPFGTSRAQLPPTSRQDMSYWPDSSLPRALPALQTRPTLPETSYTPLLAVADDLFKEIEIWYQNTLAN